MSEHVLFDLENVDFIRSTLAAAHVHLHAQDMADSQRQMRPNVRSSSLTTEVANCLAMVEKEYADYLMAERDRMAFSVADYDEDEDGDDE